MPFNVSIVKIPHSAAADSAESDSIAQIYCLPYALPRQLPKIGGAESAESNSIEEIY